jgi:hypothetical protein
MANEEAPPFDPNQPFTEAPAFDPSQPFTEESSPSVAADVAKSGGIGVAKGAIGVAGLPGDIQSILHRHNPFDWLAQRYAEAYPEQAAKNRALAEKVGRGSDIGEMRPPTSSEIQHGVEGVTGKFYEPQTTAGQYAETIGEFAPGVVGGGEALVPRLIKRAVVPGAASEAAGEATEGTSLEPWARAGAGIIGQHSAGRLENMLRRPATVPTIDDLYNAADQGYKNARGYGVEISRQHVSRLADDILSDLDNDGFRNANAPKTFSALEELKNPTGANVRLDDIESVRKALRRAGKGMTAGEDREASRRSITAIDNYLSTLNPNEVVVNPHYASDVGREIGDARGNWASASRAETIANREEAAVDRSSSTGSGANINNATRQNLRWIIDPTHPERRRGFTDDEVALMRRVVRGTFTGNITRAFGKFAPTGVVSSALGVDLSLAAGAVAGSQHDPEHADLWGMLALPLFGKINKVIGDRSTARGVRNVEETVRSRSPLYQQTLQPARPTPPTAGDYAATAALARRPGEDGSEAATQVTHAPSPAPNVRGALPVTGSEVGQAAASSPSGPLKYGAALTTGVGGLRDDLSKHYPNYLNFGSMSPQEQKAALAALHGDTNISINERKRLEKMMLDRRGSAMPPGVPPGSRAQRSDSTGLVRWVAPDGTIYSSSGNVAH